MFKKTKKYINDFIDKCVCDTYFNYVMKLSHAICDLPMGIDRDIYKYYKRYCRYEKTYLRRNFVPLPMDIIEFLGNTYDKESLKIVREKAIGAKKGDSPLLDKHFKLHQNDFYEKYFKDNFKSYYDQFYFSTIEKLKEISKEIDSKNSVK